MPRSELFRACVMSALVGFPVVATVVIQVPLLAVVVVAAVPVLFSSAATESPRLVDSRLSLGCTALFDSSP